jgi:hypothetical protein
VECRNTTVAANSPESMGFTLPLLHALSILLAARYSLM